MEIMHGTLAGLQNRNHSTDTKRQTRRTLHIPPRAFSSPASNMITSKPWPTQCEAAETPNGQLLKSAFPLSGRRRARRLVPRAIDSLDMVLDLMKTARNWQSSNCRDLPVRPAPMTAIRGRDSLAFGGGGVGERSLSRTH